MGAGGGNGDKGLDQAIQRAESRVGKTSVTGRYHKAPKRLTDDYTLSAKVLGSGYNGQVHMATSKQNKQQYAVKGFKLHGVSKDKKEELETECEIFLGMDHPHVARLVDVYEDQEQLSLVMECMTGGELFKRVSEKKRFSEKDGADTAWQMLLALNYIHSHDVVHRDIKLENFLYDTPDSNHLKLIDFGFSKVWAPNTKMALSCGTLAYVAPEVLGKNYTSQCDLWSLGVTVFIVLFGYMPFSGSEDRQVRAIKEGRYTVKKDVWARVSQKAQDFVTQLLILNPKERLTAEMALLHPWIHERDKLTGTAHIDNGIADALTQFAQASSFRRACMGMMAWSLTNEERAKVRDAFIELDADRTGAITLNEFKKVMEEKFHVSDENVKQIFDALDQNHMDEIHYSEFLAAMVSTRIALHDDLLKATFHRFDTDNTGYITPENLKEIFGGSSDAQEMAKLVAEVDTSKDGKISYAEWIQFLKNGDSEDHHMEAAVKLIDSKVNETGRDSSKTCRRKSTQPDLVFDDDKKATNKSKDPSCCAVQ